MTIAEAIAELEANLKDVRFDRLKAICTAFLAPRALRVHLKTLNNSNRLWLAKLFDNAC
jgi:hypothetical protein